MNALQGIIKNGQVLLDGPALLPEGTRVEVHPVSAEGGHLGMSEADWPTTPEGIAALLSRMDQIGPGWLSPEDEASWRADLRSQKERDKKQFLQHGDDLRRMWE